MHFLRNALVHASKGQRQLMLAMIKTIFAQDAAEAAHAVRYNHAVIDQRRNSPPRLMFTDAENVRCIAAR